MLERKQVVCDGHRRFLRADSRGRRRRVSYKGHGHTDTKPFAVEPYQCSPSVLSSLFVTHVETVLHQCTGHLKLEEMLESKTVTLVFVLQVEGPGENNEEQDEHIVEHNRR